MCNTVEPWNEKSECSGRVERQHFGKLVLSGCKPPPRPLFRTRRVTFRCHDKKDKPHCDNYRATLAAMQKNLLEFVKHPASSSRRQTDCRLEGRKHGMASSFCCLLSSQVTKIKRLVDTIDDFEVVARASIVSISMSGRNILNLSDEDEPNQSPLSVSTNGRSARSVDIDMTSISLRRSSTAARRSAKKDIQKSVADYGKAHLENLKFRQTKTQFIDEGFAKTFGEAQAKIRMHSQVFVFHEFSSFS